MDFRPPTLIESGDVEGVRGLLSNSPNLAAMPFADGSWPLHLASANNEVEIDLLVHAGAPLHPTYPESAHTALSWTYSAPPA